MSLGLNAPCSVLLSGSGTSSFCFDIPDSTASFDLECSKMIPKANFGDTGSHRSYDNNGGHTESLLPATQDTLGARDHSSLLLATPSFISLQAKVNDISLSKTSSTLLFDPRSLPPTHSLLSDTPSFLGLKGVAIGDAIAHQQTLPSTPNRTAREPRPSIDSARGSTTNRNVTVQRLALDLTQSPRNSLSVLLNALEDTAPGWYQSLMDSAISQEGSESPLPSSPAPHYEGDSGNLAAALSPDMLASLDALEALAAQVRRLPLPRPKTRLFEDVESVFSRPDKASEAIPRSSTAQLVSPPSTPTEAGQRQQSSFYDAASAHRRRETIGSQRSQEAPRFLSTPPKRPSHSSAPPSRVAVSNLANHPKLSRTLGLSTTPPSRLPAPSAASRRWEGSIAPPDADCTTPPLRTIAKKASMKSLKAPKTPKALKAIFRSRSPVPPVPAVPDYDGEADGPVRKPPLQYRFSEAGLRREDRRIDGMSMKRHFSSDAPARRDPDSFLFM